MLVGQTVSFCKACKLNAAVQNHCCELKQETCVSNKSRKQTLSAEHESSRVA